DVPGERRGASRPAEGSAWDGVRYLAAHPPLAGLVVLTGFSSLFAWPALTLLPAYTRLVLGMKEEAYSWLVSALGAGALVGAAAPRSGTSRPGRRPSTTRCPWCCP